MNKQLLELAKSMAKYNNMDKHITEMFSAFAIVLKENTDMSDDDVEYMLQATQAEWNKAVSGGYDIADKCLNEYGIDVRRGAE